MHLMATRVANDLPASLHRDPVSIIIAPLFSHGAPFNRLSHTDRHRQLSS
jgi:hypothetical protein